jgi:hypothetical protein
MIADHRTMINYVIVKMLEFTEDVRLTKNNIKHG